MVNFKNLIERLKHLPIGIKDLKKLVPPKCGVLKLSQIKGVHRSSVFKKFPRGIIVLLPSNISKVGHYVALIPKKRSISYFSSLGNSAKKESTMLHTDENIMNEFLGSDFVYNRTTLQNANDFKIQTCAMWCVCRLYLSDLKLREFTSMFSKSVILNSPDDIVSILCLLAFSEI